MSLDFGDGVDKVTITILSNNTTDITLQTDPRFKGKVEQPGLSTIAAIAEHALSLGIEVNGMNILYDFGGLGFAILKNLQIFNMKPESFQKAVLSHGHLDHFGTLPKLLPMMGPGKEIIVDPDIYKQKIGFLGETGEYADINTLNENFRAYKKAKKIHEFPGLKKSTLESLTTQNQQKLIETQVPVQLTPGIWTSGEIELFDESELTSNLFLKIDKTTFERETFRDEIAIYIKVKDKGLVVLTGCGHAGIMNTIKNGQKISGIDDIYAVIGGFHLNWSTEEHIDKVVDYFNDIKPAVICGMHCTGFNFNAKLHTKMSENTTIGVVGTKFHL
jgi:7,8-dihydropterin-6-yl-methyl-4-(beta-D-ribofuranosyl)aminobenzene 5'-phosphate synthase